jgi:oligoribonuclease
MSKKAKLLWIDLEMTGLDPEKDRILEIAAIATDWDFNEVARMSEVVKVPNSIIKKRMVGEFWDKNFESYTQLVMQNENGKKSSEVEEVVLEFVDKYFGNEVILAGNSIHQDRRFIRSEWKKLDERLHYRMFDVSAWKVYFENALDIHFVKRDMHRAMDDIEGSIEEISFYLEKVKGSKFEKKKR